MAKTSRTKTGAVSALDYLSHPEKHPPAAVCAVFGDEAYLKREVLGALRRDILGEDDGEFALSTFAGREAQLNDVLDALATVSLFADGRRLTIIEDADPFVSQYRAELEDYVAHPARGGVLVLDVRTWPGNTRLAKAVASSGLAIECKRPEKAPEVAAAKRWLAERAHTKHDVRLDTSAMDALCDLLPFELGILEQELAKLALLAPPDGAIDDKLVRENVGGWRTRTAWEMIDAAVEGRARDALAQLDRLIAAGEKPHGLLPQMSSTLRRFATAARLVTEAEADRRRLPLSAALKEAGVPPFRLRDAEQQLRQIGRDRAMKLTEWLLAADLAMKGHNSSDARARMELERLIVRLSASTSDGVSHRAAATSR